jgi:hypothetical protein
MHVVYDVSGATPMVHTAQLPAGRLDCGDS